MNKGAEPFVSVGLIVGDARKLPLEHLEVVSDSRLDFVTRPRLMGHLVDSSTA